jgi:3-hydroxyisobutyrate dehydrogenase
MGSQLAMRVINVGYPVSVYNRNEEKTKQFEKLEVHIARSPMALAENCDFLLICVTDFEAVKKSALQQTGLLLPTVKIW